MEKVGTDIGLRIGPELAAADSANHALASHVGKRPDVHADQPGGSLGRDREAFGERTPDQRFSGCPDVEVSRAAHHALRRSSNDASGWAAMACAVAAAALGWLSLRGLCDMGWCIGRHLR
jgi:hypothetical protein